MQLALEKSVKAQGKQKFLSTVPSLDRERGRTKPALVSITHQASSTGQPGLSANFSMRYGTAKFLFPNSDPPFHKGSMHLLGLQTLIYTKIPY